MRAFTFTVAALLAATLALAEPAPPQAREGDSVAWHVVQAGETLSSITYKYLGDSSLWPENHRLNPGVKDPNKLTPGQRVLVITAREIAARRAKVDKLARKVDKKLQQESWLTARIGDQLVEREGLRTYESSSAELGLDDGTRLQMTENSIVFLREYKSSIRKVDRSRIEVVEGGVDLAVAPAKPRTKREVEVLIGDVQARPKSTGGSTEARARRDAETKSAKLMVYAGATEVESAGVKVQVPKGMGTSVVEGAPPPPPQKLLAAPALVTPAAGAESRGATELAWSPVPKADSYIVEVCRDAACSELAARQVGLTATTARFESLPPGSLHWRVTARSKSGLDGFPSRTRGLSVKRLITGRVMLDERGAGDAASFRPIERAIVSLYGDDGDGEPGENDAFLETVRTDASGAFALDAPVEGIRWVVVQSRSASPEGAWREQTWGPAGSLCADGKGGTMMLERAGPCFGGRRASASDAPELLATAEHVAKVELGAESAPAPLDFAFSGAVVTTTADAEPAAQGSLRQFVLNAAIVPEAERSMRFVPTGSANAAAGGASWWRVVLAAPLPQLAEGTRIDGGAWSRDGAAIDSNPGALGTAGPVGADGVALSNPARPELEISGGGTLLNVVTSAGRSAVSNVAITGATQQQVVAVGSLAIENCIVGPSADGALPSPGAQIGVDATGDVTLARSLVAGQALVAVRVWSEDGRPKLRARDLEAVGCGAFPAIQVRASGAVIERTLIRRCDGAPAGAGLELQGRSPALGVICRDHRVTGSTIRGFDDGIVLRLGAMDNTIEGNVIEAGSRGIMLQHMQSFWTPKGNRISRNRWIGDAEPISLEGLPGAGFHTGKMYEEAVSCAGSGTSVDRALDFMGVGSIVREESALRVRGQVCPDSTVEIYSRSAAGIEFIGSVKGDAAGAVDAVVETPGSAPRDLALVSIDKTGTTSRMKFGTIK